MIPRGLTIAGSDSCGGAGLEADLKTFAALGVYGACAVTAVTAQNARGVVAAYEVPAALVAQQIDAVLDDVGADAVKTGMLSSAAVVEAVAERLAAHNARNPGGAVRRFGMRRRRIIVVDPVIIAKDGTHLLTDDGVRALREKLLPLATLVTPNAPEAEALTGLRVGDIAGAAKATRRLVEMGARAALVKGGHLAGPAVDVLWDGRDEAILSNPRLPGPPAHGTGCVLSAAITAYLARDEALTAAVAQAREFLQRALANTFSTGGDFRLFAPFEQQHGSLPGAAGPDD